MVNIIQKKPKTTTHRILNVLSSETQQTSSAGAGQPAGRPSERRS